MTLRSAMYSTDGKLLVLSRPCDTCIFAPGNRMHLEKGRLAGMIQECRERQTFIPCHETMEIEEDDDGETHGEGPICNGFYEKWGGYSQLVRIFERLGSVRLVDPDTVPHPQGT